MFDGNPRSGARRRPVNMGGRNTKTAKTRTNILQETAKLRQERWEQQQKNHAAVVIQKRLRSYRTRLALLHQLLVLESAAAAAALSENEDLRSMTRRINVSLRLLQQQQCTTKRRCRRQPLSQIDSAEIISNLLQSFACKLPPPPATADDLYCKYIWQEALYQLRDGSCADDEKIKMTQTILNYCLPTATALSNHVNSDAWKRLGLEGLLLLSETCLVLRHQPTNGNKNASLFWLWSYVQQIIPRPEGNALLGVLQQLLVTKDNSGEQVPLPAAAEADVGLVALVRALLQNDDDDGASGGGGHGLTTPGGASSLDRAAVRLVQQGRDCQNLLAIFDSVLDAQHLPTTLAVPLVAKIWQLVPALMHTTTLVARQGPQALKTLDGSKKSDPMQVDPNEGSTISPMDVDSEDDDDDEDQHVTAKNHKVYTGNNPAGMIGSSNIRVTKQDILTAPKFERLFCETRDAWVKRQTPELSALLAKSPPALLERLTLKLAKPRLWLDWAQVLLTTLQVYDPEQVAARHAYIHCLALLLQGNQTGMYPRTSAGSPFLTQLAFAGGSQPNSSNEKQHKLVELLWRYILVQDHNVASSTATTTTMSAAALSRDEGGIQQQVHALETWSIFCDVFCQQLIAVRDDQFLRQHTVPQEYSSRIAAGGEMAVSKTQQTFVVIFAEHVIVNLKQRLYELYWGQPVLTHETKALLTTVTVKDPQAQAAPQTVEASPLAAARVRLFLTGTKLWNSLYERWCRLVRHAPFCDESTWLFPHISSLIFGDGIVRGIDGGVDHPMDVDEHEDDASDSDDEAVEGRAQLSQEDVEAEALAGAFQDPKIARILTSIPQCLPFERRVKLFSTLLQVDKARTQDESDEMRANMLAMMRGEELEETNARVYVEIRRDALYHDSMEQLNRLGPKLKKKVKVSFINQHGTAEAGIDGGGVFKEFLDDLIKEAFTPPSLPSAKTSSVSGASVSSSGPQLFAVTPLETLMVNTAYTKDPTYLAHYEFLGRAVGKAVYESILVEPQFCLPFLNTLLGKSNTFEDLKNYDPEFYKSLVKLMAMSQEDIASTGLTFEANLGTFEQEAVELVPGGSNKPVTKDNVIQYAHLISHRLLNVQGAPQTKAFLRGFRDLIPAAWVRLFSAHELQKLVSGDDMVQGGGIDVASFQRCMSYSAGYHPSQPIIQYFWKIVEEMTAEQQRKFLKFMTSCSRQPLLGFGSLDPRPCIQMVRLPDALFLESPVDIIKKTPLPTASTCMNLLKLPNYRDKELMRRKLLAAIEAGAGFELS